MGRESRKKGKTFEERREFAIERDRILKEAQARIDAAIEAAKTPEQREQEAESKRRIARAASRLMPYMTMAAAMGIKI